MYQLQIVPFSKLSEQYWMEFHQSCSDPVLFYQYPFLEAYSACTNDRIDVLLFTENKKPLVALPGKFDRKKKIFSNLTYLGWDNLNFLAHRELPENAWPTVFSEIHKEVILLIYRNISESCKKTIGESAIKSIAYAGFRCPYIKLPNAFSLYLESISVSSKRMINRKINFCRRHGVSYRFITNTNKVALAEAFSELNRLHAMRMDEVGLKSKFLKLEAQKFHQALRDYSKRDTILIIQAIKDEKVIGALYGFVSNKQYSYFASGMDPEYGKYSLGTAMMAKAIDYAINQGFAYFDFLRGTENYKFKWTRNINQNYTIYSFVTILGKLYAMQQYWAAYKSRLGRKKTLANLSRFLRVPNFLKR